MTADRVHLRRLHVRTRLGVPDAERAQPQTVVVDIEMVPLQPFEQLEDQLERAVDYHAVARRVAQLAGQGERRLVETLAAELAAALLAEFPLRATEVTVEKTALPQAAAAGATAQRER